MSGRVGREGGEKLNQLVNLRVKEMTKVLKLMRVWMESTRLLHDHFPAITKPFTHHVSSVEWDCTYKEFLACNPKEYDGKRGVVVYTRWIEKIESVQDMSGCGDNQKVKYTAGSFVGK
ncbi:hypothetical protein Tco_1312861 [Tanacetum coccineum]